MARDVILFKLLKALPRPGCVICRLADEAAHRYLDSLLYENVNDPGTRAQLRASQGFCREHAREVASMRDAFGLAIVYRDILSSIGETLKRPDRLAQLPSPAMPGRDARRGQRLSRQLAAHHSCPACIVRHDVSVTVVQTLVNNLADGDMAQAFAASSGLCLPHFRDAIALAETPAVLEILANKESQAIAGLVAELSEFIRKHDYRFASEGMGPEADSWLRAMSMMIGELGEQPPQHPPEASEQSQGEQSSAEAYDDHNEQSITTSKEDSA